VHSVPEELAHEISWDDGTTCRVRPIRRDDDARLVAFHARLSSRTAYLRFFTVHPELSRAEVERFTQVDYDDRFALVVEHDDAIVAVGRYDRLPDSSEAEVAFVVADEYQHRGIGSLLLDELAAAALPRGITTFVASTLAENATMLGVFAHAGFKVTSSRDHETISLHFPIVPDDAYRRALAARRSGSSAGPVPC
jgi:GNAT superfamily N-acetyltransferase